MGNWTGGEDGCYLLCRGPIWLMGLSGVNQSGLACLMTTTLGRVYLWKAYLRRTNLTWAYLGWTNLDRPVWWVLPIWGGAYLRRTNLAWAYLGWTNLDRPVWEHHSWEDLSREGLSEEEQSGLGLSEEGLSEKYQSGNGISEEDQSTESLFVKEGLTWESGWGASYRVSTVK